jgi:nucleoside-diphosphate-sugar epimerase
MNPTRILVTGANGFVGSRLVTELLQRGFVVVAAVRQCAKDSQIAVGNIDSNTDWRVALKGVSTVIHTAARVHVMNEVAADPMAEFREVNVGATLNLARQAASSGVRRFIFVSSVKVNGESTTDVPFSAFDVPAPQDFYGQSKLEAETALRALAIETGLEVVIVRPPLVYGENVRANFLRLMKLSTLGLPLPLGGITNHRSMIALDNLVDVLIACVEHPDAANQVFLVSDDHDVGLSELMKLMATAGGKNLWLIPAPIKLMSLCAKILGKSSVTERLFGSLQVDIEHTKNTLNWRPVVSIEDALRKTVAHLFAQEK